MGGLLGSILQMRTLQLNDAHGIQKCLHQLSGQNGIGSGRKFTTLCCFLNRGGKQILNAVLEGCNLFLQTFLAKDADKLEHIFKCQKVR